MRVDERRSRALACWAASKRLVRVNDIREREIATDEYGQQWLSLGGTTFQLMKGGRPMAGVVDHFPKNRWVIAPKMRLYSGVSFYMDGVLMAEESSVDYAKEFREALARKSPEPDAAPLLLGRGNRKERRAAKSRRRR